jgi:hypothetical protein
VLKQLTRRHARIDIGQPSPHGGVKFELSAIYQAG